MSGIAQALQPKTFISSTYDSAQEVLKALKALKRPFILMVARLSERVCLLASLLKAPIPPLMFETLVASLQLQQWHNPALGCQTLCAYTESQRC